MLHRKEEKIKSEHNTKDQIKTITQELLNKLNENYNQGKQLPEIDNLSQVDSKSETSSVADEREIQHKLQQILQLLNEQPDSQ